MHGAARSVIPHTLTANKKILRKRRDASAGF